MNGTVSAIIPTYNYGRFVGQAIDSVLAQTYPAHEVVVVDDGSTDETPEILARYGDRIRTLRQKNAGVAAARNAGLAAARGEYVAFLDSDDLWLPSKLERQIALFDADPALGLVHCGVERLDRSGKTISAALTGLAGWVAPNLLALEQGIVTSSAMLPKRIAEEVGGFDPRLPPSEDWDFCYRVALRYRVGFVPELLVRYYEHGGGIHLDIPRMENGMLLALEKAFRTTDPAVQPLRRRTYGRMHRILAGCYFQRRDGRLFLWHMLKSLRYDARNASYFAAYPFRAARRAFSSQA